LLHLCDRRQRPMCIRARAWEATNLYTVASAIVAAARRREETRGSHWREDFPERADGAWQGHLVTRLVGNTLTTTYEPLEGQRS
ncbi:L-aspartate oxidase, partial [Actinomadura bangladeshensis]